MACLAKKDGMAHQGAGLLTGDDLGASRSHDHDFSALRLSEVVIGCLVASQKVRRVRKEGATRLHVILAVAHAHSPSSPSFQSRHLSTHQSDRGRSSPQLRQIIKARAQRCYVATLQPSFNLTSHRGRTTRSISTKHALAIVAPYQSSSQ